MRDLFVRYDINNSGKIEFIELLKMFHENGIKVNESDLKQIFNMVDKNCRGALILEEFE